MQHKQEEAPGAQALPLPCPGDSWDTPSRAVATGLWLSQAEEPRCVPGDKQQPLSHCWPSHALEAFPSGSEESCRAQPGEITAAPSFQGLFSCSAAGGSALVLVGGSFRVFGFPCLPQAKQCVLCASCPPVLVPVASQPPKVMQTPPSSTERSEAASPQPFPQVFPSG